MLRDDFIERTREHFKDEYDKDIPFQIVDRILVSMTKAAMDGLMEDGEVKIRNVITLNVKEHPERNGFDAHKQMPTRYQPKKNIRCKIGKQIIEAIN